MKAENILGWGGGGGLDICGVLEIFKNSML